MNFAQALDCTLEEHGITAKWLSERSGVSQQMISGFRKGNQRVYSDSLEKIVATLPIEAKHYFFTQLAGSNQLIGSSPSPTAIVKQMNKTQLAELLVAVADEIQQGNSAQKLIPA
jgi:transcriptional regulator with XRE-family HTH domain